MSKMANVIVLVEGPTEQLFIKKILAPYLGSKNVFLHPSIPGNPRQKGGDVRFAKFKKDIGIQLKQCPNAWVTLLVDYYGIKTDWPGYEQAKRQNGHTKKFEVMCQETKREVEKLFANAARRFIPYISMHEFETLLFSDPAILANGLGVQQVAIDDILRKCGEAEAINDKPDTAPSKRLKSLSSCFIKTVTGISIAQEIGIDAMRKACPLFSAWIKQLESLR